VCHRSDSEGNGHDNSSIGISGPRGGLDPGQRQLMGLTQNQEVLLNLGAIRHDGGHRVVGCLILEAVRGQATDHIKVSVSHLA
jgi:hypothetical protein